MAKKKKSKNRGFISAISALLGIVAIIMIIVPAISVKDSETTYTGLQITLGYTESSLLGDVTHFEFSFMNVLAYLFALGGVVFVFLSALGKGSKFASFIAFIAFVASAIFFFMSIELCIPNKDIEKVISGLGGLFGTSTSIKDSFVLAFGTFVSAGCSILAGLIMAYKAFAK